MSLGGWSIVPLAAMVLFKEESAHIIQGITPMNAFWGILILLFLDITEKGLEIYTRWKEIGK
jgi:polynucleotide 5'-kinase involved in rRNA processing